MSAKRHDPAVTGSFREAIAALSIAWLPFELEAIAACETVCLGDLRVPVARAEDLLIYKTIA